MKSLHGCTARDRNIDTDIDIEIGIDIGRGIVTHSVHVEGCIHMQEQRAMLIWIQMHAYIQLHS